MGLHGGVCVNRDRHRYWSAYIADVQGRMLLRNWNVVLEREAVKQPRVHHADADEAVAASVDCLPGRREATVKLHERFDDYSRAEQRHIVVHELLHLHLAGMKTHLVKQFGDWEGGVRLTLYNAHISHEEYAVDDLARIIAPSMPLPPKVKP
jgi:hypothetical protein